ncbi:MAG: hypothetical protein DRI01_03370, partial [Chloroflexi bacterium]
PDIDDKIRFVIPIMLDKVSVKLGPWSGYNVLAHHLVGAQFYGKLALSALLAGLCVVSWLVVFSILIWVSSSFLWRRRLT